MIDQDNKNIGIMLLAKTVFKPVLGFEWYEEKFLYLPL